MLCVLMSNSILILCSNVVLVSELQGLFCLLMLRTSPLKGGSDDLKRVREIDYM